MQRDTSMDEIARRPCTNTHMLLKASISAVEMSINKISIVSQRVALYRLASSGPIKVLAYSIHRD